MLDLHPLSDEFAEFGAYQAAEQDRRRRRLARACDVLDDCAADWQSLREEVHQQNPTALVAGLREAPDRTCDAPERPTPITAVATDGSQIYPDRHVEPTCYLLNTSRVAFQYGTLETPVLDAEPHFEYRGCDLAEHFDAHAGAVDAEIVSALRDEQELDALLDTSRAARREGRPLVALADGTLIRWMIRGLDDHDLEEELIGRYAALLEDFRAERLPLASYISMPGNTAVVNLLRLHLDDPEGDADDEALAGLLDRWLFAETLAVGERTATFTSASRIQERYAEEDRICYFYVRVPSSAGGGRPDEGEIARVEVPRWVADDEALLDRVHALVASECEKGDGYPMILSEAHERAVIRMPEKERFYRMIERAMEERGLPPLRRSRKAQSKRRPTV
ncbi:MAG: hypothetical protein BRD46_01825 [Bacteroidetes bacterium QS_8_68_15]|nr:MAG: hypothetical protein BRD46_01825 [Bacteroidetes bacterium QS_8_68_15]